MKASKLIVEYDYDFEVLGIISSAKDYKLAYNINKALNIDLEKTQDLSLEFLKDGKIQIAQFVFETEYSCLRLLKNKPIEFYNVSKPFLIPEMKEYDYFIHLSGEGNMWNAKELESTLKIIPIIQYVLKIDINNLKSRENLIF
ncbi:MAG: IPExxxVDY family protein [Cytophagaceae bacterium]